jgi:hypothetical protein
VSVSAVASAPANRRFFMSSFPEPKPDVQRGLHTKGTGEVRFWIGLDANERDGLRGWLL